MWEPQMLQLYWNFRGICCLHHQGRWNILSSEGRVNSLRRECISSTLMMETADSCRFVPFGIWSCVSWYIVNEVLGKLAFSIFKVYAIHKHSSWPHRWHNISDS
jgi:hypothetical protein